ncbi:uncharacterized protein M6D78_004035 [Vipera latastei]
MKEIREEFVNRNNQMREDIVLALQGLAVHIDHLDDCVDSAMEHVENLENKIIDAEQKIDRVEAKIDRIEDELTILEYKNMEFALRIRGLKENPKEDLEWEVAQAAAPVLKCEPEELLKEMDKTFRVNSWIARQKKLPRDVVIYFSRRLTRNSIIQAFYREKFQIAGQDIMILKEIPHKILRKWKDFAFLSDELKKRQIQFRWEIPIGIVVNYAGTRYRLDTILKAKDFYTKVLKAGSPPSPRIKRIEVQEDKQLSEGAMSLPLEEMRQVKSTEQSLALKKDPKEQRMTRAAYKRMEKEQKQKPVIGPVTQDVAASELVGGVRPKRAIADL